MPKRTSILIDGSNFYFKLKDLGFREQLHFDFRAFSNYLFRASSCIRCIYYIGAVKTDGTVKTKKLHASQQKLFQHLKKNGFEYSLGYLLKSDGKYHEKGVDVHIAVDMLSMSYEDRVDSIILISSDTDLIPAINKVKELKKKVKYVGFTHAPSVALTKNCSSTQLLSKKDIVKFITKKSQVRRSSVRKAK